MSEGPTSVTDAALAPGDLAAGLIERLIQFGLTGDDVGSLLAEACAGLNANGIQVWRGFLGVRHLHPSYSGLGFIWHHDRGLLAERYEHRVYAEDEWLSSPIRVIAEEWIARRRLRLAQGEGILDYPLLAKLEEEGATDWFGTLVTFGELGQPAGIPGMVCTWTSDRPGGFGDAEIEAIEQILPALGLATYRIVLQQVASNLLQTYTGADAGRRILRGQVRRGAVERITAVFCIADIRGFTRLADVTPGEQLLGWLNDCLGAVTDAIEAHGGQVLKFLGDGLLAVFRLDERAPSEVCAAALAAAERALAACAALDKVRAAAGSPPLVVDMALHLGEVLYGNIGSERRLDFTVVGPAVNEASRIEALCEPLGRQLLLSSTFTAAYGGPCKSLGLHALRGVEAPQELFTIG